MLALLALFPAVGIAWWWLWRARRLHRLMVGTQVAGLRGGVTVSRGLLVLALALIAVAASRPMWDTGEQTLGLSDFSLVVALDVSLSMAAEDVGEETGQPVSRITAAKSEIRRLIDGRRGDRVGLVIFAGDAFLRFPLTRDHEAALQVLEALQPGEALVPPGSNIAAAIEVAAETVVRASEDDGTGRINGAIAVVSDGETHTGDAELAASTVRALGLQVFVVGVGTERGGGIPLGLSERLKLDIRTGSPIVTRLDSGRLRRIADAGGGRFIELDAPGSMSSMNADLAALDLVREVVVEETSLAEQFQWFAGAAVFALLAAVAARVFGWSVRGRLGLASIGALAASAALVGGCSGPGVEQANRDGLVHYEAAEYNEALEDWRLAQRRAQRSEGSVDSRLHLNAGRALHQLHEYERAETETLAALRSENARVRAVAWFHVGNHRWTNDDLLGARQAYVEALRETPELLDAKINLEIVNGLLASLQDDPSLQAADEPGDGGEQAQASQGAANLSASGTEGASESSESGGDQTAVGEGRESGDEQAGFGQASTPVAPTFAEEQSLVDRRQEAMQELREALEALPLENASLEQALAVLDALRAVPGERLAAGRLEIEGRPLDW
ncbi:MAG: VWA domain-containing protein [Chloroflexota bacterium]|nr:VWA domain-containing protein [Chloroflexota bacterium]